MSDITTFDQLGRNDPREEHYTITLAKLPDVQARLRWVLEQVERAPVTALGVEVPPDLLREALAKIERVCTILADYANLGNWGYDYSSRSEERVVWLGAGIDRDDNGWGYAKKALES